MKVKEIDIQSEYYPKRLLKIERPPQKLFVLGNIDILNDKGIAIVGSRDCTNEGIKNLHEYGEKGNFLKELAIYIKNREK